MLVNGRSQGLGSFRRVRGATSWRAPQLRAWLLWVLLVLLSAACSAWNQGCALSSEADLDGSGRTSTADILEIEQVRVLAHASLAASRRACPPRAARRAADAGGGAQR